VVVVLAVFAPLIFSEYWVATLLTQMLFLGIVAASLIFLSAYGGMVSLAQVSIYGVAGFALGNLTTNGNTKGLNLGWAEAPGIVVALVIAVVVAFVFGALASRSYGIYFLMITLVFSVIANLFFGQVTSVSGFGGISGIPIPSFLNRTVHPDRLYFVTLLLAALVYLGLRYVARTPFGLVLQGIRDDPVRMRSLGYSVTLHRALAFTFAGFVAAVAGILFVWWNAQIAPSTIGVQREPSPKTSPSRLLLMERRPSHINGSKTVRRSQEKPIARSLSIPSQLLMPETTACAFPTVWERPTAH
jgi:branched-chain amino acid transport system permease protein